MAGRSKVCMRHEADIATLKESTRWIKRALALLILIHLSDLGLTVANHLGWW